MNESNINNFTNVKNDILKCLAYTVAQATDVFEMIRQHVAQSGSEDISFAIWSISPTHRSSEANFLFN